jgi:hypothetical protein
MASAIGIGLIGAGKHGQRYAAHVLRDIPSFRLAALAHRDVVAGRRQASEHGAHFHADWRDLVADPAVHAVAVVVPPALHRPIVEAVAAAGKALLIEKPLATTAADARAIVRIARAAGIPTLMAHTLRWNVVVNAIRALVPSLGELRALALNQRFEVSKLDWLDRPESGGGVLLNTGVHSFDLRASSPAVRSSGFGAEPLGWRRPGSRTPSRRSSSSRAAAARWSPWARLPRERWPIRPDRRRRAEGQLVGDHLHHFAYRLRGLERTPMSWRRRPRRCAGAGRVRVPARDEGSRRAPRSKTAPAPWRSPTPASARAVRRPRRRRAARKRPDRSLEPGLCDGR